MYAGLVTVQVRPKKMDGFVHIFEGSIVPALRGQHGFRGTRLFVDPTLGKSVLLTLWESEADMTAFEASGGFQEQLAKFQPVLGAPATLERFEVRL